MHQINDTLVIDGVDLKLLKHQTRVLAQTLININKGDFSLLLNHYEVDALEGVVNMLEAWLDDVRDQYPICGDDGVGSEKWGGHHPGCPERKKQ